MTSFSNIEDALNKLFGHKWVDLINISPLEGHLEGDEEEKRCQFCNIRRITWSNLNGKLGGCYYTPSEYAKSTKIEPPCKRI